MAARSDLQHPFITEKGNTEKKWLRGSWSAIQIFPCGNPRPYHWLGSRDSQKKRWTEKKNTFWIHRNFQHWWDWADNNAT
jgi:hypothetical protein